MFSRGCGGGGWWTVGGRLNNDISIKKKRRKIAGIPCTRRPLYSFSGGGVVILREGVRGGTLWSSVREAMRSSDGREDDEEVDDATELA